MGTEWKQEWKLVDMTNGKNSGYLQLRKNCRRVADFFPYGVGSDEQWVREQARMIVEVLNATTVCQK